MSHTSYFNAEKDTTLKVYEILCEYGMQILQLTVCKQHMEMLHVERARHALLCMCLVYQTRIKLVTIHLLVSLLTILHFVKRYCTRTIPLEKQHVSKIEKAAF